jgi:hypothetical protein
MRPGFRDLLCLQAADSPQTAWTQGRTPRGMADMLGFRRGRPVRVRGGQTC